MSESAKSLMCCGRVEWLAHGPVTVEAFDVQCERLQSGYRVGYSLTGGEWEHNDIIDVEKAASDFDGMISILVTVQFTAVEARSIAESCYVSDNGMLRDEPEYLADAERHISKMAELLARDVITPTEFGVCATDHMAMDGDCDPHSLVAEMTPVARDAVLKCIRDYAATDYYFIPLMIGPPRTEEQRQQSAREMQPKYKRVGDALSTFFTESER